MKTKRQDAQDDESLYDSMPGLEEPDDDVDVYRPERDRVHENGNIDVDIKGRDAEHTASVDVLNLPHLLYRCSSKASTMLRDIDHEQTLHRIQYIKSLFPQPDKAKGFCNIHKQLTILDTFGWYRATVKLQSSWCHYFYRILRVCSNSAKETVVPDA